MSEATTVNGLDVGFGRLKAVCAENGRVATLFVVDLPYS